MCNDKNRHIGHILKEMSNLMKRNLDKRISIKLGDASSTGGQGFMLGFIADHEKNGNVYQKDLESQFNIRRSSVTGALQLLERNGFIIRESDPDDARLKRILLTQKGIEHNKIVHKEIADFEMQLREGISDEELLVFCNVIEKMRKNLDEK